MVDGCYRFKIGSILASIMQIRLEYNSLWKLQKLIHVTAVLLLTSCSRPSRCTPRVKFCKEWLIALDRGWQNCIPLLWANLKIHQITVFWVNIPIVFAHCNSGFRQILLHFFVLINEHLIYGCQEHRTPPVLDIFPPGMNPDWIMENKSRELPTG